MAHYQFQKQILFIICRYERILDEVLFLKFQDFERKLHIYVRKKLSLVSIIMSFLKKDIA